MIVLLPPNSKKIQRTAGLVARVPLNGVYNRTGWLGWNAQVRTKPFHEYIRIFVEKFSLLKDLFYWNVLIRKIV